MLRMIQLRLLAWLLELNGLMVGRHAFSSKVKPGLHTRTCVHISMILAWPNPGAKLLPSSNASIRQPARQACDSTLTSASRPSSCNLFPSSSAAHRHSSGSSTRSPSCLNQNLAFDFSGFGSWCKVQLFHSRNYARLDDLSLGQLRQ